MDSDEEAEMRRLRGATRHREGKMKMSKVHQALTKRAGVRRLNLELQDRRGKSPEISDEKFKAFVKQQEAMRAMLPKEFDMLHPTKRNQPKVYSHDRTKISLPKKTKGQEVEKWLKSGPPVIKTEMAQDFVGVTEEDGEGILEKAIAAIHDLVEHEGISGTPEQIVETVRELEDLRCYYNFLIKRIVDKKAGVEQEDSEDQEHVDIDFETIEKLKLPVSNQARLKDHTKCVAAMALNRSGSRLLTGSLDFSVKLWDFNSMREDLKSFRSITPEHGHVVFDLSYCLGGGSQFFVVTGSATPRVYDREGKELIRFQKGDMYLKDLTHTKGHVMACTGGTWHPRKEHHVLSWGTDGTVRIWDLNGPTFEGVLRTCVQTVKTRKLKRGRVQGGRLSITAACCSKDFSSLVVGCNDGSIQCYDTKGNMKRGRIVENAHSLESGQTITRMAFDPTGTFYVSRAMDNTLKVWDKRKRKTPFHVFEDLPNHHEMTGVQFSPDGKYILTGTSVVEAGVAGSKYGCLVWLNRKESKEVLRLPISTDSVTRILQHQGLDQIFAGCADGSVVALYDAEKSVKGVLLCATKEKRKKKLGQHEYLDIYSPNDLPEFKRTQLPWKRKGRFDYEKYRKERKIPQKPVDITGRGVDLLNENQTHFLLRDVGAAALAKQDPRDALLKWECKADEAKGYTAIYNHTQPKPKPLSAEEPAFKKPKTK